MPLSEELRRRLQEMVTADEVVLFMKGNRARPQCGFSAAVVQVLSHMGVKFKGVDVLAVCPGGTKTEFAERAQVELHGMEADAVVSEALNSIGKKASVVSGFKNKFLTSLLRLCTRKARTAIGAMFVRRARGQH